MKTVLRLIHVTRERKLENSKQRDESRSPYLGIHLVFSEIQRRISKTERRFRICHGLFEMFRPANVSVLGRENRPGRPLHKETKRRIIDRYLTGEGPTAISTAARGTPGAVYCIIIRHYVTFGTSQAAQTCCMWSSFKNRQG